MLRNLCLATALLFSLNSFAQFEPLAIDNPNIGGAWVTTQPLWTGNGLKVFMGLDFNTVDSTLTVTSFCAYASKTLEVSYQPVAVSVSGGTFSVPASSVVPGGTSIKDGSLSCSVDVKAWNGTYSVSGGRMRMSFAKGRSIEFKHR